MQILVKQPSHLFHHSTVDDDHPELPYRCLLSWVRLAYTGWSRSITCRESQARGAVWNFVPHPLPSRCAFADGLPTVKAGFRKNYVIQVSGHTTIGFRLFPFSGFHKSAMAHPTLFLLEQGARWVSPAAISGHKPLLGDAATANDYEGTGEPSAFVELCV